MIPIGQCVVTVLLVWFAYRWTYEVYERRAADIEELANSDEPMARVMIVFYWVATVVIVVIVGGMVWRSVSVVLDMLR